MSLKELKKGDKCVVVDPNHAPLFTKVSSAGPKWICVNGRGGKYDRERGVCDDGFNSRLKTVEEHAKSEAVDVARCELRKFGVNIDYNAIFEGDTVLAIRAALDGIMRSKATGDAR